MKCTTLLLLTGLTAGFAAHAAEPVADEAATASYAGVTVAIDPATGRLRAPTAAEQAQLRQAVASRIKTADPMSIAKPGPKTRAEAERTMKRHPDGRVSMQVSEDMMSHVVATQLEDGSIVISHGDADAHAAPVTAVEAARE
jgi:cell wall-associated NlpC family hydrolase